MVSEPLILSVDLDGVLVNFRAGFVTMVKNRFGIEIPAHAPSWYWFRPYLTKDQEQEAFAYLRSDPSFWAWLQEEPDAHAAKSLARLSKAAQAGHVVYFMTQRPKVAWQTTVDWLRSFGWIYGTPMVLLIGDEGKGNVCDGLDVTHAIDDRIEHVQDMSDAGVTVACLTRPYNEAFEWLYRVASLPAWLDEIGL